MSTDWIESASGEKLPEQVVLKVPSFRPLRKLDESLPPDQRMFDYTPEKWAAAQVNGVHNTEVAAYEHLSEADGLAVPKMYYAVRVGANKQEHGQLCLEYLPNSRMMSFYEKQSVEQVAQIARALGKIQAYSLKNEPAAPELRKEYFANLGRMWPLETYRGMFKGILTLDNSDKTRELMAKIDSIIPKYHGSNLGSTLHAQMGFRPVLVNGDLHTGNVLVAKDTGNLLALIDWQCAHLGVGVEDLHRIAMSALPSDLRRQSMPLLVEEMYKALVQHLDGVETPYTLETILLVADIMLPHCGLFFASTFITMKANHEMNVAISEEEKAARMEVKLDKLIGVLEDILSFDIKNRSAVASLTFGNEDSILSLN